MFFSTDKLKFYFLKFNLSKEVPYFFLHGFTGTHQNWTTTIKGLKKSSYAIDLPGHGKSLFLKQAIPSLFLNPKKNENAIHSLLDLAFNYSSESIAYYSLAMRNRNNHSKNIDSHDFIIQGKKDPALNRKLFNDCQKLYGNRLYIEEKSGHMTLYENPSFIESAISEILLD